jgi:hypothetical protein
MEGMEPLRAQAQADVLSMAQQMTGWARVVGGVAIYALMSRVASSRSLFVMVPKGLDVETSACCTKTSNGARQMMGGTGV